MLVCVSTCTNVCIHIMIRKLMRIGNSVGVTLDKKMLHALGLDGVGELWVEPDKKGKRIIIRKREENDW